MDTSLTGLEGEKGQLWAFMSIRKGLQGTLAPPKKIITPQMLSPTHPILRMFFGPAPTFRMEFNSLTCFSRPL